MSGSKADSNSIGDVLLGQNVILKDVLYAPNVNRNLISVSKMDNAGLRVVFFDSKAVVFKGDDVILEALLVEDDLYRVACPKEANKQASSNATTSLSRWHKRLGHLSENNIRKLSKMVDDLPLAPKEHLSSCEICAKGKMARLKTKKNKRNSNR